MSGLTVGYNGLNMIELNAIDTCELDESDENYKELKQKKKLFKRIKPVIKNKHLLLVTLLLANAVAMEALPIFLDAIVPAYVAIILSTTAVLIFGEVIPQVRIQLFLIIFNSTIWFNLFLYFGNLKVYCCLPFYSLQSQASHFSAGTGIYL